MAEVFSIPNFLKTLTHESGVYQMFDAKDAVIYVGKAKDLRRRVSSYFVREHTHPKTNALVAEVRRIEVTVTPSESEALILENTLIKQHMPRYNVIFKDDKSYPYLYLSTQDPFPKLIAYRGVRKEKGMSFGPYPSMAATRETLRLLQKVFPIRNCEESFFKNRTRPCLQYQIKRCSAPCVGKIDEKTYRLDVDNARLFLEGKNQKVLQSLAERMEKASEAMDFEAAARLRDQIAEMRKLQEDQSVVTASDVDADVIALASAEFEWSVAVIFIRQGRVLGSKVFFPKGGSDEDQSTILQAFVSQFYVSGMGAKSIPQEVILSHPIELDWLRSLYPNTDWKYRVRGMRTKWISMALLNAEQALKSHLASEETYAERLARLESIFDLPSIQYFECMDVSHSLGEATVASCVVFNRQGPAKSFYRRFNITDIEKGDDYAAIEQVVRRHFNALVKSDAQLPTLLLIDGGKNQVARAGKVLDELQIDTVKVVGIAKGYTRKPGLEELWIRGVETPLVLEPDDPGLHLIQEIRDEAHRFAITAHRKRRAKARGHLLLSDIPGLGPKRRQALLNHFGSFAAMQSCSVAEIMKVKGISRSLAEAIRAHLKG